MRAAGVAAASLLLLAGCGLLTKEREPELPVLPEPPRTMRSVTYPVERTDLVVAIEGHAVVSAVRQSDLYFTEGGRVRVLTVEPQDEVKSGDLLAQLEIGDLEHRLELAEVDLEIARLRLQNARVSAAAYDARLRELEAERGRLEVDYYRRRIEAATIRAPYDGIIRRVQVEASDEVEAFEQIIEIQDPTELELQMRVNSDEFYLIEPGQQARVEIETDRWADALVHQATHLNPRLDASVRREEFVAHLRMTDPSLPLRLGAGLSAEIILDRREATLAIPKAGLREFRDRTYVRVLEGEVRREVDVKVGVRTATEVEILEGLEEGDLVIGR
jgi:RND family efflux transporter MFP subunit